MVALVATAESLYFSELRGFIPCTLCWYQRILTYPLVLLVGTASWRSDSRIVPYALLFAVIGTGVSLFHYLEQKVPGITLSGMCRQGVPCGTEYIDWLGFVTIPFLAGTEFLGIALLLATVPRAHRGAEPTGEMPGEQPST